MRFRSFTRLAIPGSLSFLLLLVSFARPAIAQPDEDAVPDSGTPVSRLSVSPKSIDYHVNIDKGITSETRHFYIKNQGTLALDVTVGPPSDKNFVITAPPQLAPAGGKITILGKEKGSKDNVQEVAVKFNANGPGKNLEATIAIASNATTGPTSVTVKLHANAVQKNATPTVTPTPTMTPTPSPTPTRSPTPTLSPTPTPSTGATPTLSPTATATCTANPAPTPYIAGLVLIAGGQASDGTPLNSAEVFNPATNTFTLTTALGGSTMNDARYRHAAAVPIYQPWGPTVLVTGGFNATGVAQTTEVFSGSTDKFLPGAAMTDSRQGHTATYLAGTTQVLIAGGRNAAGTVLATAEVIIGTVAATMSTPRIDAAAFGEKLWSRSDTCPGKAVITGGSDGTSALQTAEIFDPASNTFTPTDDPSLGGSQMNAARTFHTATFLANSGSHKVLIAGGEGTGGVAQASAEIFDPATNKFTLTTDLGGTNMNDARAEHTATAIGPTTVLIAGGKDSAGNALATAELFDLSTNSFTRIGSMHSARFEHTAATLSNGKILIAGGEDGSGATLATAEIFNPATNTFTLTTDPSIGGGSMNVARKLHTATAY
jgi:hypothetical protein